MPDVVWAEGNACALSDVADISGPRTLTRSVGDLLLTVEGGVITREQVVSALRVSGLENVRVELKMPEIVRVQKRTSTLGMPGEETGLSDENPGRTDLAGLIKSLAAWDGDVEAQYQGSVPAGRLVSPVSIVPGSAAVTLRFRDESGRERSLGVRLTWTQPALVLTRSLKRGEILKESDLEVRQIRVNRPGVYASKVSEAAGRSVRKNISQGEALTLNSLTDAPIIERGKNVTIVARSGNLTVNARGEAMESGALGDAIRVRNTATRAVLTAVVVAEDTVEVKMP